MKRTRSIKNRNVFFMGLSSFFNDIGSEMILPILPLFLMNSLGAGQAVVGLVEGVAESTSSILKLVSGWLSDRFGSRKPLVVFGYTISNISKPLLSVANSWPFVLAVRFSDRVGKGIRTSPRDALIAASSERGRRGRSFGLHRMMDTSGAIVGVLITFSLVYFFSAPFHLVFLLTAVPGVLSVLTVILFVREKKPVSSPRGSPRSLGPGFGRFILVSVLFTLGNFSYAFLLLRAQDLGVATVFIPLLYLLYNIVYAISALPLGRLADKIGKKRMLSISFLVFSIVSLGFGLTSSVAVMVVLFALYGIFQAIYEVSARAIIPLFVGQDKRGTAYGIYHTSTGLAALPASFIMGVLWQFAGVNIAFGLSALLSIISSLLMALWVGRAAS